MTRRTLWTVLASVVALMLIASQAPTLIPVLRERMSGGTDLRTMFGQWTLLPREAAIAIAAISLLGLVVIGWWWQRRLRKRRAIAADATVPFAAVLDRALDRGRPAPAPSPRQQMVADLARGGQSVAEIARATRLSQDAVRSLLAVSTEPDRHDLPPHPAPEPGGDR
ncbi:MAG: hypothetical protein U0974_04370 [Gemmatimonadales bacterium]|nr:hypothetical protein [Gemmatimonadales bacterium]MDZ4388943.1 hypothetical protein [Gemmatimonadales bacterium]